MTAITAKVPNVSPTPKYSQITLGHGNSLVGWVGKIPRCSLPFRLEYTVAGQRDEDADLRHGQRILRSTMPPGIPRDAYRFGHKTRGFSLTGRFHAIGLCVQSSGHDTLSLAVTWLLICVVGIVSIVFRAPVIQVSINFNYESQAQYSAVHMKRTHAGTDVRRYLEIPSADSDKPLKSLGQCLELCR